MFGADKGNIDNQDQRLQGKNLRIGIVQARFNQVVTNALSSACRQELLALGAAATGVPPEALSTRSSRSAALRR